MDYSKLIKHIRDTLFLTQNDLANMLDVSFATINRWENGRNIPSMKEKKKIHILCLRNNIVEGNYD